MKRPLPSQHEAARITRERLEQDEDEARRRRDGRIRAAFDWLLKQENGRIAWGYIFDICGYSKPSLSYFAAGDVAPLKTECKEAQRAVYIALRKLVTPELLARAEFEAEFGNVATDGKPKTEEKKPNAKAT